MDYGLASMRFSSGVSMSSNGAPRGLWGQLWTSTCTAPLPILGGQPTTQDPHPPHR